VRSVLMRHRGVLLGAAALVAVTLAFVVWAKLQPQPARESVAVVWMFEQAERGAIISTPVITEDCVYVAAIRDSAFAPSGVVYCLDRQGGSVRWKFDDDGAMKHTYSTPCLADGRLYVGEGMHGNDVCKMYCLDTADGRKVWEFVTDGHIESSPCIADGAVFFGSGDDGLYCLDAASGSKRWQFHGKWHVDVRPEVMSGRVYAGSGISLLNRTTEIFCLDASNGQPLWRTPTELPVWGSPVLEGDQVFFGTGTGRLTMSAEPPEKPAGALLCADAKTGKIQWSCPVADAVFSTPAVDAERVYFGARDGRCYCLDRRDGRKVWQQDLRSPMVTRPALVERRLYIAASGGQVCCLDVDNGRPLWTFDLAKHTQTRPQLLSSPVVMKISEKDRPYLLYLGTELRRGEESEAVLYCLRP
jgi:outer membrane protein assembly factor BamB